MSAFENLSDKINHAFSKLKNKGKLTELEIKQAMREVKIALLEADVNFKVVKDFVNTVTEKAIGEDILSSLTPAQQVIDIVHNELVELMGTKVERLAISSKPPTIIMMCGLQGAGKTTMCGKLGLMLKKQNKKVMLVACDIYRPAAIKQLEIVANKAGVMFYSEGQINPVEIVKHALVEANKNNVDYFIVDTAGRLHIDEQLMQELIDLKSYLHPNEILLTVDSMTGQDAVNVAETFNNKLDITGVVLTKLDGDTRGGAALSIRAVTGKPIKFSGVGEKMEDIEPFHPDRMASRILGMGDVLTLIEKAKDAISEEEALKMSKKLKERGFTLEDYLVQMDSMKKMGSMNDIMGMIPGFNRFKGDVNIDEKQMDRTKAIIQSMTRRERLNPDIIKASQKKRIAQGSGTSIQEVNQLLKQFDMARKMMKNMQSGKKMKGLPFRF